MWGGRGGKTEGDQEKETRSEEIVTGHVCVVVVVVVLGGETEGDRNRRQGEMVGRRESLDMWAGRGGKTKGDQEKETGREGRRQGRRERE